MYVAVKGGERAIENAHRLLASARRGDQSVPEISLDQISEQLGLAVDRVMSEGSLYDRELASLAIKQARGDLIEAIFLVRAFRATLPRFGATEPVETGAMRVRRRVSSTFKDIPGGQILGPTFDYTHRLLDPSLAEGFVPEAPATAEASTVPTPRVTDILGRDGLIESSPQAEEGASVGDLTREPLNFPADRDLRLQNLARGDEGFLLAMGYSTQRGYGRNHPFAGEIRFGEVEVEFSAEDVASPFRSARSSSPSVRWSTSSRAPRPKRRASPAAMALPSARANARPCRWRWSTARCARASSAKRRWRLRKMRNS